MKLLFKKRVIVFFKYCSKNRSFNNKNYKKNFVKQIVYLVKIIVFFKNILENLKKYSYFARFFLNKSTHFINISFEKLSSFTKTMPTSKLYEQIFAEFRFLFFQFWIKDAVGRAIDAVRDLEEPEFSARDRNTQVFLWLVQLNVQQWGGGANLLNDENQEFCKTFEHVLK